MNLDPRLNQTANIIKLMAHTGRLQILFLLTQQGPLPASLITNHLSMGKSLLAHHLSKMKAKGLLNSQREGREVLYWVSEPALKEHLLKWGHAVEERVF